MVTIHILAVQTFFFLFEIVNVLVMVMLVRNKWACLNFFLIYQFSFLSSLEMLHICSLCVDFVHVCVHASCI